MPQLKYRDPVTGTFKDYPAMMARVVTTISGNVTASAAARTDYVYACSVALTLTLPTAVGNTSRYTVKRTGTGTVTVATSASQTVDGAATVTIGTQWQSLDLVSDGANWMVV